eukprot:1144809-Pelagomonas_calceolata.AAC.3
MRVTWVPSWEPEKTKDTWPKFQQRLLEFEARQSEPDLCRPTADSALSNLERQGFEEPDAIYAWKQKLDSELRNKIIFDIRPLDCWASNPREDIKPTSCSEFWLHDIDLVKYKAEKTLPTSIKEKETHWFQRAVSPLHHKA